jgi:hypothetical protein
MTRLTHDEVTALFQAQGVSSHRHYAVKCVACETVQSMQSLVDAGCDPNEVQRYFGFSCVGRWKGAASPFTDADKLIKGEGCNWTLGGLFHIHKFEVVDEEGKGHPMFEIATPLEAQQLESHTILMGMQQNLRKEGLSFWAIYENPRDFPGKFVVRQHFASKESPKPVALVDAIVVDSIEKAREAIPAGLLNLGRHPADDPVIHEVWM